jgi:uncharacterized protein (TIGR02598 family)
MGFSLVEVVLAIGILGFCMIPIMGLIPVAMKTSRQSMDRNTEIRMMQTIRAELLKAPFSQLAATTNFYFDAEGYPLISAATAYYAVTASNLPTTVLPTNQTASHLKTCQLVVVNTARGETNRHSLHLPDNGF